MPKRKEHTKSSMQSPYTAFYGEKKWKSMADKEHKRIDAPSQKHPGMAHRKYRHDYIGALAKAPSNMPKSDIAEQHISDDNMSTLNKKSKKLGL